MNKATVKVTAISSSRATGETMVCVIAYQDGKAVDPNWAHENEWPGIPGLVSEPDFRSGWYGWGLNPWTVIPEAGKPLFNARGAFRKSYIRRVKRAVRARARKAGVKVEFMLH